MVTAGTQQGPFSGHRRPLRLKARLCAAAATLLLSAFGLSHGAAAEDRALTLYNLHTKERATIVFKRNGTYDSAGLSKLNQFLRDWRRNQPTKMDPKLFDLLWEVYRQGGSQQPINVVCGFRSPQTNAALRRRSKGVASKSQHMLGKAMDFYIPGVPLSKLRAIGLRMQAGGVGFYPSSGSPFVHMDTGSVRHWPRMTRSQLVAVFPEGKTVHVPSDGKPLPGYAEALAAYKARRGAPVAVASYSSDDDEDAASAVTVAAADVPLPRLAPGRPGPVVVAEAAPALLGERADRVVNPTIDLGRFAEVQSEGLDFDATYAAPAAAVPVALASAMAERDQASVEVTTASIAAAPSSASLPIPPTAVVATVDVPRSLRAEVMTTAVLRRDGDPVRTIPTVLAFASAAPAIESSAAAPTTTAFGVPLPHVNPLRLAATATASAPAPVKAAKVSIYDRLPVGELTLTALDTQGLRLWIANQSTREKRYALMTMPDFSQQPALLQKPEVSYAAGFSHTAYPGLRTDRFAGQLVQPPEVVDLTALPLFASAN